VPPGSTGRRVRTSVRTNLGPAGVRRAVLSPVGSDDVDVSTVEVFAANDRGRQHFAIAARDRAYSLDRLAGLTALRVR